MGKTLCAVIPGSRLFNRYALRREINPTVSRFRANQRLFAVGGLIRVHSRLYLLLLRPWMGLIVRLLQPLNRDMRINLRRRKALVAKQGLNAAKIGAVL